MRPATRRLSLNVLWVLIAACIGILHADQIALVETGFTRNKNVVRTMMMNMMVFCASARWGYWLVGFCVPVQQHEFTPTLPSMAIPNQTVARDVG